MVNLLQAILASMDLNAVMNIIALPFALVVSMIAATAVFRKMHTLQGAAADVGVSIQLDHLSGGGHRTIDTMNTRRRGRRGSDALSLKDRKTGASHDGFLVAQKMAQEDASRENCPPAEDRAIQLERGIGPLESQGARGKTTEASIP
ncbi:hypothetical protein FRB94_009052 [Tulasnella sp. JGI-2019a]|nr:hypothetical protein FRB94_009052 [Tulasnella sp. JGI-2019a]